MTREKNQRLSKREKILIFIAGIVLLIFVLFQFVIMPMYNNYLEKSEEKDKLSSEKIQLDMKFESENNLLESHENTLMTYKDIVDRYPALISSEEIDRILTGVCLQNKLNPIALGISEAVEYIASQPEEEQSAAEDGEEETEKKSAAFCTVTASMTVKGNYDSLKNLINTVDGIDYIRIAGISFSAKETSLIDSSNISLIFEITMMNDTQ